MQVTIKGNAASGINFAQLMQALEPFLAGATLVVKPAEPKSESWVEYPSKPYPVTLIKGQDGSILARVYTPDDGIRVFKSSTASEYAVCYRDVSSGQHAKDAEIVDSIDAALWLAKQ